MIPLDTGHVCVCLCGVRVGTDSCSFSCELQSLCVLVNLQLRSDSFPGITFADLFTLVGSLGPELAGGPPIAWWVQAAFVLPQHMPPSRSNCKKIFTSCLLLAGSTNWNGACVHDSPGQTVACILVQTLTCMLLCWACHTLWKEGVHGTKCLGRLLLLLLLLL